MIHQAKKHCVVFDKYIIICGENGGDLRNFPQKSMSIGINTEFKSVSKSVETMFSFDHKECYFTLISCIQYTENTYRQHVYSVSTVCGISCNDGYMHTFNVYTYLFMM